MYQIITMIAGAVIGGVVNGVTTAATTNKKVQALKQSAEKAKELANKYSGDALNRKMTEAGQKNAQELSRESLANQLNNYQPTSGNAMANVNNEPQFQSNYQDFYNQGANREAQLANAQYNKGTADIERNLKQADIDYNVANQTSQAVMNGIGNAAGTIGDMGGYKNNTAGPTVTSDERCKEAEEAIESNPVEAAETLPQGSDIQKEAVQAIDGGRDAEVNNKVVDNTFKSFDDVRKFLGNRPYMTDDYIREKSRYISDAMSNLLTPDEELSLHSNSTNDERRLELLSKYANAIKDKYNDEYLDEWLGRRLDSYNHPYNISYITNGPGDIIDNAILRQRLKEHGIPYKSNVSREDVREAMGDKEYNYLVDNGYITNFVPWYIPEEYKDDFLEDDFHEKLNGLNLLDDSDFSSDRFKDYNDDNPYVKAYKKARENKDADFAESYFSDERTKESVVNNDSGLPHADIQDSLRQLESVKYKYTDEAQEADPNSTDNGTHVGSVTQSYEKTPLFKDAVVKDENGIGHMDIYKLNEALAAGLAEMQREIDELTNKSTATSDERCKEAENAIESNPDERTKRPIDSKDLPIRKTIPGSEPDPLGVNITNEERLNWNNGEDHRVSDTQLDEMKAATASRTRPVIPGSGFIRNLEQAVEEAPEAIIEALPDSNAAKEAEQIIADDDKRNDEANNEAIEEDYKKYSKEEIDDALAEVNNINYDLIRGKKKRRTKEEDEELEKWIEEQELKDQIEMNPGAFLPEPYKALATTKGNSVDTINRDIEAVDEPIDVEYSVRDDDDEAKLPIDYSDRKLVIPPIGLKSNPKTLGFNRPTSSAGNISPVDNSIDLPDNKRTSGGGSTSRPSFRGGGSSGGGVSTGSAISPKLPESKSSTPGRSFGGGHLSLVGASTNPVATSASNGGTVTSGPVTRNSDPNMSKGGHLSESRTPLPSGWVNNQGPEGGELNIQAGKDYKDKDAMTDKDSLLDAKLEILLQEDSITWDGNNSGDKYAPYVFFVSDNKFFVQKDKERHAIKNVDSAEASKLIEVITSNNS